MFNTFLDSTSLPMESPNISLVTMLLLHDVVNTKQRKEKLAEPPSVSPSATWPRISEELAYFLGEAKTPGGIRLSGWPA